LNVFGKEIKNAKCQKCDKAFPVENNSLDSDPLHNIFEGQYVLRKEVVDGKEIREENPLKKDDISDVNFSSATEL
jgi:hypothetical protein